MELQNGQFFQRNVCRGATLASLRTFRYKAGHYKKKLKSLTWSKRSIQYRLTFQGHVHGTTVDRLGRKIL